MSRAGAVLVYICEDAVLSTRVTCHACRWQVAVLATGWFAGTRLSILLATELTRSLLWAEGSTACASRQVLSRAQLVCYRVARIHNTEHFALFQAPPLLKYRYHDFIGSLSRRSYVGLSLVSMNAWFWASVFHSRDRPVTEALDYHSATAVQFTAAVAAAVRVFELSPKHRYGCTVGLLHVFFGLRRHGIVCCGVPTQRRARDS